MEQTLCAVDFELAEIFPDDEEADNRTRVAARLIEYAQGLRVALPPHTAYGLIEHPEVVAVPGSAAYAHGLMTWQNKRIPLLNLEILLNSNLNYIQTAFPRYALIVAYQSVANFPVAFGAIGLNTLPQTILVGDGAQCSLPDDRKIWQQLALSCFHHEGQSIPILDTAQLFSGSHRMEQSL
jgi:hypothetical protein